MMNQFEAICFFASEKNWCWNLYCTTCGHWEFRNAFFVIASGKSFEEGIVKRPSKYYWKKLAHSRGYYSEDEKEKIINICLEANISSIATKCKFPDWLGYLGLILTYTSSISDSYKSLSSNWAKQLKEHLIDVENLNDYIPPVYSEIHTRLDQVVNGKSELLNIRDLEKIERQLR